MIREINISPWKPVHLSTRYDHHTLINYATLITQNTSDDYFYFYDDIEKIIDVSLMPNYIKEDWLNYNKKELNIAVLNSCISNCIEKIDTEPYSEENQKSLETLKLIRREHIIKGLI